METPADSGCGEDALPGSQAAMSSPRSHVAEREGALWGPLDRHEPHPEGPTLVTPSPPKVRTS